MVELMDQSEEDTWKVKNILESGSVSSIMGGQPAAQKKGQVVSSGMGRFLLFGRPLEIFWGWDWFWRGFPLERQRESGGRVSVTEGSSAFQSRLERDIWKGAESFEGEVPGRFSESLELQGEDIFQERREERRSIAKGGRKLLLFWEQSLRKPGSKQGSKFSFSFFSFTFIKTCCYWLLVDALFLFFIVVISSIAPACAQNWF